MIVTITTERGIKYTFRYVERIIRISPDYISVREDIPGYPEHIGRYHIDDNCKDRIIKLEITYEEGGIYGRLNRQVAIDAIEEYADRLQMVNWKENPNVPYKVYSLNWRINTIRDLPSAQPTAPQWTPCSERLPEVSGAYLVTGKMKYSFEKEWEHFTDVAYSFGTDIDHFWDTCNDWDEGQEIHIIAWMPLPEPWKGEENDKL